MFLVLDFVFYVSVFIFLEDWLGLQTSAGSLNALIFTFLDFPSLLSFFACFLTDPSGIPSSFAPDVEDSEVSNQELKKSAVIIWCAIEKDWNFVGSIPLKIFYICSGAMTVGLFLTLGTLLGWHIDLIIQNMTSIEHSEAIRAAWLARKSGQNYRHPFHVGVYKNITWSKHVEMAMPHCCKPHKIRRNYLPYNM